MAKAGRSGLGLLDRLVLLVAWVLTCGIVYVLGLYVGKGMQEQRLGRDERVVRLPVTSAPPAAGQQPRAESDLTFYDTLVAGGSPPAEKRPAAVPPPPTPPRAQPQAATPPAPAVAPPAPPAAVATAPAPSGGADAHPPAAAATPPSPADATAPATAPPPSSPTGGWTVQANPTRDLPEAQSLAKVLRGRGYDAVVVRVRRDGDTWYRVRVGRYATSEQATQMMQRLREREHVPHVFVASE
jgi:cell division protein FtsN